MNGDEKDARWCLEGDRRYTEYGVVGAEQADETHFDDRSRDSSEDEAATAEGRIKFSTKRLYGRDKELMRCKELYFSEGRPVSVFFSGYSGSGKSQLVEEFVKRVSLPQANTGNGSSDGMPLFLRAKYESIQSSSPLSAIGTLFDDVDKKTMESFSHIKFTLQDTLGTDSVVVRKVFPGLRRFLRTNTDSTQNGTSDSDSVVSGAGSGSFSASFDTGSDNGKGSSRNLTQTKTKLNKERLIFALKFFFQLLVSDSNRPLIIFVDDLQWADPLSLELLQSMLTDPKMGNLFFVGAYRSNEVDAEHPVTKMIEKVEGAVSSGKAVAVERMELKELTMEDIGEFIADSLRLQVDEVEPLTQAVFTKTLGNPFFTRQALEQLVRKNALYYDTISFAWSWNLRQKELEDLVSDDLVEMVKSKISHMGAEMQQALVVASCTKSTFDVDTLLVLLQPQCQPQGKDYNREKRALVKLLEQAVEEGLLIHPSTGKQKQSKALSNASPKEYSFAHDRVQEAARSLIAVDEEYSFLNQIGQILYHRALSPATGQDWMYFAACEHLNRASRVSLSEVSQMAEEKEDEEDRRRRLAALNLRTAELSMDLLAFPAAIDFCENGMDNLPLVEDDRWSEKYYDLTLKLYSISAEAHFGIGNTDEAEQFCDRVIQRRQKEKAAVPIHDAISIYIVYLDIFGGKGQKKEALAVCLDILDELGISFPKGERLQRAKAWWSLKQIKARRIPTAESMQDIPQASDPHAIDTMEILLKAVTFSYAGDDRTLYILLCCESVKRIFDHGLTEDSAGAIASFANILMHVHGDFEISESLAELAILITDKQRNKFNETRPLNTANANVLGWVRPMKSCLKYHHRAYESGLASGNLSGGFIGKWFGFWVHLFSATPLEAVEKESRTIVPLMRQMGQPFFANLCSITWQISLNLIGKPGNENTSVLTGEAMDENLDLYQKTMPTSMIFQAWKSFALIMFGDFEAGAKDAMKRGDFYSNKAIGTLYGFDPYCRAMSLFAMARRPDHPDRKASKREALRLLKHLKTLVKKGCVNLAGPTRILDGELAALRGKSKVARTIFEDAVAICRRGEFHQFAGLASERFAAYLLEVDDATGARLQLTQALSHYNRWGARRKVSLLQERINLMDSGKSETRSPN